MLTHKYAFIKMLAIWADTAKNKVITIESVKISFLDFFLTLIKIVLLIVPTSYFLFYGFMTHVIIAFMQCKCACASK